ncbi:hypothetical protein PS691_05235 [Pseudomonas fluorescens]|uniref:Secreted protein n=1 Tax=Pseudomonas fluorescens TaxID=294 RepID=A0A5E7F6H1_PSEFL|nr:hypothetical protein PS691_05235 [Pseudomonas fluorescens]
MVLRNPLRRVFLCLLKSLLASARVQEFNCGEGACPNASQLNERSVAAAEGCVRPRSGRKSYRHG